MSETQGFGERQVRRDPLIGKKINQLEIVEKIGEGGFGAVYRAEHSALKTSFAVKVLHLRMHDSSEHIIRFQREAQAVAQLTHPNVIRVSDFGQLGDGSYYQVMEFLKGQTLQELLESEQQLSLSLTRYLFRQICSALEHVHSKGIVHRDIKPANIFLAYSPEHPDGQVKLLDFGIAALEEEVSMTRTGMTIGSPLYMSPEQASGDSKNATTRSDIYSVGIILYEMLTGVPPFRGSLRVVMYKHLQEKPPSLGETRPHLTWALELEEMIQRVLSKEPTDRHLDAASLLHHLEEGLVKQELLTPSDTEFSRVYGSNDFLNIPTQASAETVDGELKSDLSQPEHPSQVFSGDMTTSNALPVRRSSSKLVLFGCLGLLVGVALWGYWILNPTKEHSNVIDGGVGKVGATLSPILIRKSPLLEREVPERKVLSEDTMKQVASDTVPSIRRVVLRLQSRPASFVWLGKKRLGQTPYLLNGTPGKRFVFKLRARGYRTQRVKIVLLEKAEQERWVTLKKLRSRRARPNPRRKKSKGPFGIDDPI